MSRHPHVQLPLSVRRNKIRVSLRDARRSLLTVAAAASILFSVAVTAMWVRSYFVYDYVVRIREVSWHFSSCWGRVTVHVGWLRGSIDQKDESFRYYQPYPPRPVARLRGPESAGVTHNWRALGFRFRRAVPAAATPQSGGRGTADHNISVGVPYWFLVLLTGAPPGWWFRRRWHERRRERRRRLGQCEHCGYDLRGSPQRCPECGLALAPVSPRALPATA